MYPKTTSLQEVCLQLGLRLLDVIFGHLIQFAQRNAGLQCSDEKVENIEQNSIVLFLVLVETVRVREGITTWEGGVDVSYLIGVNEVGTCNVRAIMFETRTHRTYDGAEV